MSKRLVAAVVGLALVVSACESTGYVYDESGRLRAVSGGAETVVYRYDEVGNIVGVDRYSTNQVSVIEFSPDRGPAGTEVVIQGTGFSETAANNTVDFNGTAAPVTKATKAELTVTVPSGASTGPINVAVTDPDEDPDGSAASTEPFTVQADRSPTVTGVAPQVVSPGDTITITGTNFSTDPLSNAVVLGGLSYMTVTSATATELQVEVPPVGTSGRVSVATADGTGESAGDLWVVPAPHTPASVEFKDRAEVGGDPVTVDITTDGKIGMLVFDGQRGKRVSIGLTGDTFLSSWPRVSVYGPGGLELGTSGAVYGTAVVDPIALPSDGTYTAVFDPTVSGPVGAGAGSVTAQFYDVPADAAGEIVAGGGPVTVTAAQPGQNPELSFDGQAGHRMAVHVTAETLPGNCPVLRVLAPDGRRVGFVHCGSANTLLETSVLPATGPYRIVVDPNKLETGTVTLRLYDVPADVTGAMSVGGAPFTAAVSTPGQNVSLTFQGTAGQRVSVSSSANSISAFSPGRILSPGGTTLASFDLISQSIDAVVGPVELPATGTYRFTFDPVGAATGSISFRAHDVPADVTGTISIGGSPVPVTVGTPGQNAELTFSGTEGQRVSLGFTDSTFPGPPSCPQVRVFSPTNAQIGIDSCALSREIIAPFTLPANGTYRIPIDPQYAATGAITLRLYNVPPDPTAAATVGGPPVSVQVTAPGQLATLTFATTAGQRVALTVDHNVTTGCDLRLIAPNGTQTFPNCAGATRFVDTFVAQAGTYTLRWDPSNDGVGTLTTTVHAVPADVTGSVAVDGPPLAVSLASPGQNADVAFAGTTGQNLTLNLTDDTFASCEPDVRVLAPNGSQVTSVPCVDTDPETRALPSLTQTGTYHVVVNPTGAATGNIAVQVTSSPAAASPPVDEPEAPAGEEAPPGDPAPAEHRSARDTEDVAVAASTVFTGVVEGVDGNPLAGVVVRIEGTQATTTSTGAFTLPLPATISGRQQMVVDGRTASGGNHGTFVIGVDVVEGATTALGYTIHLPELDTGHQVTLTYPLTQDVVVTNPAIPDLEVHIPAGSEIRDLAGELVTTVGITPIPADTPPFPLPNGANASTLFTVQPGGATLGPNGLRIEYPNSGDEPAGAWVPLVDYSPEEGWEVYGTGTVSTDGSQILPGQGQGLLGTSGVGAVIEAPSFVAPPDGLTVGSGGALVDIGTGLFTHNATDLSIDGIVPLSVGRTYRHDDTTPRAFGRGWSSAQDLFLYTPMEFDHVELVLPDGVRLDYQRLDPGTTAIGAVFEHRSTPGGMFGSQIRFTGRGWELRLKDGSTSTFGTNGFLQSMSDPTGRQLVFRRERRSITGGEEGNVVAVYAPLGRWLTYSYDDQDRVRSASDSAGRTVTYTYDTEGRLDTVTDPASRVLRYGYDTSHRLSTITDPADTVVLTNEYTDGRVSRQVLADESDIDFAYQTDTNGHVIRTDITAASSAVRRVTFDNGYWMTDTAAYGSPLAQTSTVERDPGTRAVIARIDHAGRRTTYTYDDKGNVETTTVLAGTPDAVTTSATYNPTWNKVATETDALDRTTTYTYDDQGNLHTVEDPEGGITTVTYDEWGRPASTTNALEHAATVEYELLHRVTTTDPLGHHSSQFIDAAGRTGTTFDAVGGRSRVTYDAIGRPVSLVDPTGDSTTLAYWPNGKVRSLTDAAGNTTEWTYDELGRVETRTDPLGATDTFEYDTAGNLDSSTDRRGILTEYDFDLLSRSDRIDYGVTATDIESSVTYSYDTVGRLDQLEDTAYGLIELGYDPFDRVETETTPAGTVTYDYDDAGQRTSMSLAGGPSTTYTYDDTGALTTITQGGNVVQSPRDALDRPETVTLPNGITATYTFDARGQLTKIVYNSDQATDPIGDLSYTYDAAGRRRTASGSLAKTALPEAVDDADHDPGNRLTSWDGATLTYDDAGNLTGDGTNTYTWDARGQLAAVDGPVDATFEYDSVGRRTEKTIGADTTSYQYDGPNIIGQETASSSTSYLTGLGVDEVFARNSAGVTTSYLADGLGSTVGLVGADRAIATKYAYSPFGDTTLDGAADPNPFQYTGREQDETGLQYNRARYYNPETGRFISEDPIGFSGGDPNLFAYVSNSPTNATDPSGLCSPVNLGEHFAFIVSIFDLLARWGAATVETRDVALAENWTLDEITAASYAIVGGVAQELGALWTTHIAAMCGTGVLAAAFGKLPKGTGGSGLKCASSGLAGLFAEGTIRGSTIIGIRSLLLNGGFDQVLSKNKKGYLFTNGTGEEVRIMRRDGGWDVRVRNQYGNDLDEFGNVAEPHLTHEIKLCNR